MGRAGIADDDSSHTSAARGAHHPRRPPHRLRQDRHRQAPLHYPGFIDRYERARHVADLHHRCERRNVRIPHAAAQQLPVRESRRHSGHPRLFTRQALPHEPGTGRPRRVLFVAPAPRPSGHRRQQRDDARFIRDQRSLRRRHADRRSLPRPRSAGKLDVGPDPRHGARWDGRRLRGHAR